MPKIVGEAPSQMGNPQSKTTAFMKTYTREVVSRYKDSPAIWGWEFATLRTPSSTCREKIAGRPPMKNPPGPTRRKG